MSLAHLRTKNPKPTLPPIDVRGNVHLWGKPALVETFRRYIDGAISKEDLVFEDERFVFGRRIWHLHEKFSGLPKRMPVT
jgi:hypothetical protein